MKTQSDIQITWSFISKNNFCIQKDNIIPTSIPLKLRSHVTVQSLSIEDIPEMSAENCRVSTMAQNCENSIYKH